MEIERQKRMMTLGSVMLCVTHGLHNAETPHHATRHRPLLAVGRHSNTNVTLDSPGSPHGPKAFIKLELYSRFMSLNQVAF